MLIVFIYLFISISRSTLRSVHVNALQEFICALSSAGCRSSRDRILPTEGNMNPKEEIDIKLLLNYPLISRTIEDDVVAYKGILEIADEDYKILIKQIPQHNFWLELLDKDQCIAEDFTKNIKQPVKNIIVYLDLLQKYLLLKFPSKKPENHCDIYQQVLFEYSDFSKFYLNFKNCYLSQDLGKISVTALDDQNREHNIEIQVHYNDRKNIFQIFEFDLPFDKGKLKKSSNLKDIYNQFAELVEGLQPFFTLMDDFDKNCDILDPVPQKRRYNYRRIWLGDMLSIIITVDPFNLGKMPIITFLGPERMVELYRDTMNNNLENWEPNNYIYSEILKLIGLDHFPKKPIDDKRDDLLVEAGDCCICFSSRLNDKLPEIICKNANCNNCYHTECLYEWLMSVNSRRIFTEVVGSCPNCEKNISCPIPSQTF